MTEQEHPEWLETFVEAVAGCLAAELPDTSLGAYCDRYEDSEVWEVDVFARPMEIVGGQHDGELVAPGFSLDFEGLRSLFERVDGSGWENAEQEDGLSPHLWIDGSYGGTQVMLRILSEPLEGEEPEGKVEVGDGEAE